MKKTPPKPNYGPSIDLRPRENKRIRRETALRHGHERFSMVLMLDGTMLRARGEDWGKKPATDPGARVAWHELKAGLVIRVPEASSGRRREAAKFHVGATGDPELVGRKPYAEALRRGLADAQRVYVIADGAVWIWNPAAEHFPESMGVPDFYHASQHVWALGRSLFGEDPEAVKAWVVPLPHDLKGKGGAGLLGVLEAFESAPESGWTAGQREELRREAAYFRSHASRLDYPRAKGEGMPLGSGSMESACSPLQGRFKRPGPFWSRSGERNLLALELAHRNGDWGELWAKTA